MLPPPPKQQHHHHYHHPDAMTTFQTVGRRRDGSRRSSMGHCAALVVVSCWLAMVAAIAAAKHQPPARPLVSAAADLHTWPTRQQELADEANDAQLLKAVQQSMREWNRAKAEKQEQPLADEDGHHHDRSSSERQRRRRATAVQPAEKSVCYGDLGCFEDSGPFGYLDMLPSPPEEINTRFMFYSTKNRSDNPLFEIPFLNITDAWRDLQRSANDTATPPPAASSPKSSKRWHALKTFPALTHSSVRIIVHGFGSACPHVWIYELRTALMAVEDCVVICVDWENGANFPNYVRAAANTRLVGKQLAMFLRGLQQYKRLDLNRVHLIGFSLGAHVSGFAGAELPGISRITGLDPAGPLFESQHPKARLDSTDATFVDVIHSNGENLILGGLGSYQPMGHVDFYPNGGRVQHGCSNLFVGAVTDFIWSPAAAVEGRSLCNHRRAYKFFIDSVAPRCLFPAFPCANYDDFLLGLCLPCDTIDGLAATADPSTALTSGAAKCGNMGYYADRSTGRGQLYLVTREEEPFCAHQFNIEIHSPANDLPLRTLGKLEAVLTGDGQLNETFGITEKDDSEFYAGERVSRILVPHPALGFPHAVTLRYKSYSGWLSKGLPQWTVHKVVLTDSFGAKRSLCRPDIALYSDRPVYLQLEAGDCVPDVDDGVYGEEEQQSSTTSASTTSTVTTIAPPGDTAEQNTVMSEYGSDFVGITTTDAAMQAITDADGLPREKKEVIELGKSYPIQQHGANNKSVAVPWHVLAADNENLIDAPVSVQQLQQQKHDFAIKRYVKTGLSEPETGRSISTADPDAPLRLQLGLRALGAQRGGVEEPVLRSTTLRATVAAATVATSTAGRTNPATPSPAPHQPPPEPMRPRENSVFTIQLFPFRLGELIERAERYARETLLPLISEQAPRIFRFGEQAATSDVAATGSRNARHLKYIPASGAGKPMTGERLSAAAATASESDVDGVPLMMRRQRRIDLPPQLDAGLRIEQPDFEATETVRGRSLMPNLLRPSGGGMESLRRSFEERRQQQQQSRPNRYYTAGNGEADEEMVRIALPTYRPSVPSTERTTTETSAAPVDAAPAAKVMIVTAIPIPLSAEH